MTQKDDMENAYREALLNIRNTHHILTKDKYRIVEYETGEYCLQILWTSPSKSRQDRWNDVFRNKSLKVVQTRRREVDPSYDQDYYKIKRVIEE